MFTSILHNEYSDSPCILLPSKESKLLKEKAYDKIFYIIQTATYHGNDSLILAIGGYTIPKLQTLAKKFKKQGWLFGMP
jgi:hypothetical protein